MSKKQKKNLIRIIVSTVLMVSLILIQRAIGPAGGLASLAPDLIAPGVDSVADAAAPRAGAPIPEQLLWLVLFLIPYLIVGYDILLKAWKGIKNRQPMDENLLMAIATLGAIALALYRGGDFTEAIAVMLFYQIGEWFQSYAVDRSRKNVAALMDICPEYANLEQEDGSLAQVDPDEVEVGSIIVVKPGERIPIDGFVIDGQGTLDTAALTGESVPRSTKPGDQVISGCISTGSAVLRIRTEKEYEDSTVARVLELIEDASSRKARSEKFISRFARVYTPIVVGAAVALAILPPLVRLAMGMPPLWGTWIYRALIFLVISCPCALVVSIPLSFFAGIGGASRQGVLIKGANYLEILSQADTLVFDKTGTLTEGVFRVTKVSPAPTQSSVAPTPGAEPSQNAPAPAPAADPAAVSAGPAPAPAVGPAAVSAGPAPAADPAARLLRLAASAEAYSTHPIAQSLLAACEEELLPVEDVEEIAGHGIRATIEGKTVWVGNARLMEAAASTQVVPPAEEAGTVIHVAVDGTYAGYIVISDVVKPHSKEAIAAAKRAGVRRTVMLTGDVRNVAEKVAAELGIDQVFAELLPQDKVAKVEELIAGEGGAAAGTPVGSGQSGTGSTPAGSGQQTEDGEPADERRRMVAFVGDGINDAPVLSRSDIGIAMGAMGSDAAVEAADIVLMDDDPLRIATAIRISRKCMHIVKQNIWFAIGVKVLCLVLGAVGIANMWLAIFADVGVMVLAVLNAIRCMFIRGEQAR